ncbi:hypothetical protein [Dactylosporangium vinaceum]|uniref:Uncharacterized protein n=1 Tax=Dactylosporangium vinaceum TaxID=53362 RepID=A0ABV5MDZ3_9ACTN|nr:hypothetical protein [Dactylosporangium vinaceum]
MSIHDQVEADTISGSSQGTRNSARSVAASGKCRLKNTARARPIANCAASDAAVKTSVCASAGQNVGSASTVR